MFGDNVDAVDGWACGVGQSARRTVGTARLHMLSFYAFSQTTDHPSACIAGYFMGHNE
jgi:hypothetical protein